MDVWRVTPIPYNRETPPTGPSQAADTATSAMAPSTQIQQELHTLLAEPARRLRAGQLIAFPTETVYGLGANACDETAVRNIFKAKGRPSDNPLIVHISSVSQLEQVVANPNEIPDAARRLMDAFWPGPLTIILPAHPGLAPSVHPGMETVGVRMPNHPVALALIAQADCPVAAPSANSSGRPSPTNAETVLHDLDGRIDGLVDGGSCDVGLESTVVAIEDGQGVVYRPGWITPEELATAAGIPFTLDPHLQTESSSSQAPGSRDGSAQHQSSQRSEPSKSSESPAPKSPGMKYRHYAPDAQVMVWFGEAAKVSEVIQAFVREHEGDRIALICPADFPQIDDVSARWSPDGDIPYVEALGQHLYSRLRWGDEIKAERILVVGVEPVGRGLALMNRLQKASEGRLYRA